MLERYVFWTWLSTNGIVNHATYSAFRTRPVWCGEAARSIGDDITRFWSLLGAYFWWWCRSIVRNSRDQLIVTGQSIGSHVRTSIDSYFATGAIQVIRQSTVVHLVGSTDTR